MSCASAAAHPERPEAEARYLANEGVMVAQGATKILFDPIYDNGFGNYPLVPPAMREALFASEPPFDGIDAIFVSHAHGDHFAAADTNAYLAANLGVRLIAPQQAIDFMREAEGWDEAFLERTTSFSISLSDQAEGITVGELEIDAMRVAHAGNWPEVHNMVYRVSLQAGATVLHLGDADGSRDNFAVHRRTLDAERTDVAFVPYWWLDRGPATAKALMNADTVIGIHVPIRVPRDLERSGADYFSRPGETRTITISSDHE